MEQLLLDFFNSNTIDLILNEYLGLNGRECIPETDVETRKEIALKHIKDFLKNRESK